MTLFHPARSRATGIQSRSSTAAYLLMLAAAVACCLCAATVHAAVTGRHVRVENPTGPIMDWRQIQVFSGGQNIVLKHGEMFTGTVYPDHNVKTRDGKDMTDGSTDTAQRGPEFIRFADPATGQGAANPWFEIDLGKSVDIDKIILYGSHYPGTIYLDKGQRAVTVLDDARKVVWAARFNYYDTRTYKTGVFSFEPAAGEKNPVVGRTIADPMENWVPMSWLLDAESIRPVPDPERRMQRFAQRNSPAEIERLAHRFFRMVDEKAPGLDEARGLYAQAKYQAALDAWKVYWFAKMQRVNLHWALRGDYWTYPSHGDDLVNGIAVTISATSARAIRFTPGQIHWIDLPDRKDPEFRNAVTDAQQKAEANKVSRPLLDAYRRNPDAKYTQRWAEIMDDWSLNFFEDAAQTPYEVENLFTFNPCLSWLRMMEDLSDIARQHPRLVDDVPSATLARVQMLCIEKYGSAWWRQTRETVFNHLNGGICAFDAVRHYIGELGPGQRIDQEWRQSFERFMTLATERDGSLTEIGDEGHQEIPIQDGSNLAHYEATKPAWYTPGWRNQALEWYDNLFKYMFRHLAPGGFEHRFAVDYRPARWTGTWQQYNLDRTHLPRPLDRDTAVFGIPEVRRMMDACGHLSAGGPTLSDPLLKAIIDAQRKSHDAVAQFLNDEKPGMPRINSDWMPYTGAYYFRGSWADDAPFLGMMACGSHGGSQAPQWPYSMFYHYDYFYPLVSAQPIQVDGLPPQQLFGRMNCYQPGTKTMALTNADEKPAPHRWLSDTRFDFGEAIFHGGYQKYPGFKGDWDGSDLQQNDAGPFVADVDTIRQVLQVRGSRLFVVTDAVRTPGDGAHEFSIPYKVSLSSRQKGQPFGPDQLQADEKAGRFGSANPDGPSVTLHQFATMPFQYQRGPAAKPDSRYYGRRLGPDIGIADQPISIKTKGSSWALVSLISSRDKGARDRILSIEPLKPAANVAGFHAKLEGGAEMWYQSAGMGSADLVCGPGQATGQALLVIQAADGVSGILLGGRQLMLNGKPVATEHPDCEFVSSGAGVQLTAIHTPIDPVSFLPNRNTFTDSETVQLVSKTPQVQIRYTTDGTPPTPASTLYTAPVRITETTEFAARAYRLGPDGKPLPADDFEINGTKFTVPSYGFFYKKPPKPAAEVAETELQPGLNYDYLQAPWWRLYGSGHWLAPEGGGVAAREMDLSRVSTNDSYGMRYRGYIKVPQDGLYTFHAPREFSYMDNAPSYDLRLYVDGEEWYLTQWWHGHGTWTAPLKKGLHAFQVDFADARTTPWRRSGIWNYYPRPWAVYQGKPTDILVSGPGLDKARIPQEWFFRKPEPRTYPDERTLVNSDTGLNCAFDGAVDASLKGAGEVCFRATANLPQVFDGLVFIGSDGAKQSFADVSRAMGVRTADGALFLNLRGQFTRLGGTIRLADHACVILAADGQPRRGVGQ